MDENEDVIEITYCAESGYLDQATKLSDGIKKKINADVILTERHGGTYEVCLNNNIIYTNAGLSGPLPGTEEIVEAIIKTKLLAILMGQDDTGSCGCGCG
jgi:predicted Rdx family selenoprotein